MKRKVIVGLMAIMCASSLALGLAGCDPGGNPTGNGNPSNSTPPNYAPPNDGSSDLLTFELNDTADGYVVTGLAEGVEDENIVIPSSYDGLPVVAIGERAFGSCHNLTSVTISTGVTAIGSGAFTDCIKLPSFKFPASIKTIGDSAFQNCSGLKTVFFNGTSQLEEIGPNAFQNCTGLLGFEMPSSVVTVGDRVFQNCSSLKSVNLGSSVETVGTEAFRGCTKLATVTLGDSLKSVGEKAFLNCTLITEMHFPETLERVGLGALSGCTGIKKLTIPFVGSEKYETPLPDSEANNKFNHTNFGYIFGASTFDDQPSLNLDNLETLTITGDSPIGYHAFNGIGHFEAGSETRAVGLSTIIITGNVKVIGTGAFAACYNLQTLVIPKSVTKINGQILADTLIRNVYYGGTASDWSKVSREENLIWGTTYYYSETQPGSGNYWHYVDGVPTAW